MRIVNATQLVAFTLIGGLFLLKFTASYGYKQELSDLIQQIREQAKATASHTGRSKFAPQVYKAFTKVLRHHFVPPKQRDKAYADRPLPIGYGQTISQPFIVALMTDLLDTKPTDKILEIGTGSGFQAAILSSIVKEVYTIEIVKALYENAKEIFKKHNFTNVASRFGDGYYGWEEHAPYDGIIVTAAASHVPPPLFAQLKVGGRIVIPVGHQFGVQSLKVITKTGPKNTDFSAIDVLQVRFVPFTGNIDSGKP